MTHIEAVRTALNTVFGDIISPQEIEDATFTGREDPGGWAPRAHVVIHTETGIPAFRYDSRRNIEAWDRVGDLLMAAGLFCEPVNGAVVSVYST